MNLIHCLSILCLSAASSAGEVQFAERPRVASQDGHVTVSFALSQAADVEVVILDGDGRVVRHLAAGRFASECGQGCK